MNSTAEKIEEFCLNEEQELAIDFLIDAILEGKEVIGFIAPGGCGKTFSLKHLKEDPRIKHKDLTFTATTNKAASVMAKDGIKEAKSLHSAISKHVPTKMFSLITSMFEMRKEDPNWFPEVLDPEIELFLEQIGCEKSEFLDYKDEKELIAEHGVDGYDDRVFSHYATAGYEGGVCFIDESSMLPTKSQYDNRGKMKAIGLDAVQRVYDTVVLVGDDSQLPPINGKSSFDDIQKVSLTKNMRSDDGLLRLIDSARNGENLAHYEPKDDEKVWVVPNCPDSYFDREKLIENNVVHIVYTNKTRKALTQKIRADLTQEPVKGEPIVYRGANINEPNDFICKNETGVFNGMIAEWEHHSQAVSGRNFDEYGTGFCYLQYGYVITAHTSQGSSFDYVVVHLGDIPHFIDRETKRKWIYTAVSRARKGIVIVY